MHENLCHPGFRDPYGDVSVKLKSHRLENEMRIYFCEFVRAFSDAMNLISPEVKNHHEKVGYIACELAKELKMSRQDLEITFFGAMLHDIGSLMMEGDISLLDLEVHPLRLARMGSQLLRESPVTNALADVVGNCQTPWQKLKASVEKKPLIPQVIHLADVVSLLLTEEKPVLNQIADMKECIHQVREGEFHPDVLRAFDSLCTKEYIWMNVMYHSDVIMDHIPDDHEMSLDEILATTEFMSHIIDFRSPFTAMHSAGVAASAEELAGLSGMSEQECKYMRIAGLLHDIGKMKVPKEILEKPGKLTDEEFNIIKEHAYYTHLILSDISGFEQVTQWAAYHHEKLAGNGYPFHLAEDEIPFGSRIMAVADVFSAITEERPYRKGMDREKVIEVLRGDAARGALSGKIVELLVDNFDMINEKRDAASRKASRRYQIILKNAE